MIESCTSSGVERKSAMYAPETTVFAQAHERQQQRREDRQRNGYDREQERISERLQKVYAVLRQEGKIKERGR